MINQSMSVLDSIMVRQPFIEIEKSRNTSPPTNEQPSFKEMSENTSATLAI